jgi:hypothetical protein
MSPSNDWNEWRQHVLHELARQHEDHKEVRKALNDITVQLAQLKVRAGVWGAVAGAIPVIAALLTKLI